MRENFLESLKNGLISLEDEIYAGFINRVKQYHGVERPLFEKFERAGKLRSANRYFLKIRFRGSYITMMGKNLYDATAKMTANLVKENYDFGCNGSCGGDGVKVIESCYRY